MMCCAHLFCSIPKKNGLNIYIRSRCLRHERATACVVRFCDTVCVPFPWPTPPRAEISKSGYVTTCYVEYLVSSRRFAVRIQRRRICTSSQLHTFREYTHPIRYAAAPARSSLGYCCYPSCSVHVLHGSIRSILSGADLSYILCFHRYR